MNSKSPLAWMIIPASIMLCLSCNQTDATDDTDALAADSVKTPTQVQVVKNYHRVQDGDLAAFYVMSRFNGGSPDSVTLSRWLDPFLDSISANGYEEKDELFTNNGGGVMNSQFNPDADILITAFFKDKPDTSSVQFTVNDFPIVSSTFGAMKMKDKDMYVCWTVLTRKSWNYMRHPASDKEIDSICAKRNMKREDWVNNSCTVIRIAVSASSRGVKHRSENYLLLSFAQ